MRVISGNWKGRRLEAPRGKAVRPTTDRVKEAMFNILAPLVPGAGIIDLCCGTGGLGIEALSRGASAAVFVDVARSSLVATERNLVRCKADPGTYELVQGDMLAVLDRLLDRPSALPLILLCDPPYDSDLAARVLDMGGRLRSRPGFSGAVVELGGKNPVTDLRGGLWEFRPYGRTLLAIMRPQAPGGDDGQAT